MKRASDYRQHAQECRLLASNMDGEHKAQLVEMAATWDRLADERDELLRRHPELAHEVEDRLLDGPPEGSSTAA